MVPGNGPTTIDTVDVAIAIGAKDVVKPAARGAAKNPLYGMPMLEVDRVRSVVAMKRSMRPGFAGVANPLFHRVDTRMLLGNPWFVQLPGIGGWLLPDRDRLSGQRRFIGREVDPSA